MIQIWRDGEITVFGGVLTFDCWISGLLHHKGKMRSWSAKPSEHGYMVQIGNPDTGRLETFQGATFNMGLEIASAAARFVG